MATIYTYRHHPNVAGDAEGMLVDTETVADTATFQVTVDSTGWNAPDDYTITVKREDTANGYSVSEHSNELALHVDAAAGESLLDGVTYDGTINGDTLEVTLGMEWWATVAGSVTQLKMYVPADMTVGSDRTLGLYRMSDQTLLGSGTLTVNPAAPGWQAVTLGSPVSILAGDAANNHYKVCVFHPGTQTNRYTRGGSAAQTNGSYLRSIVDAYTYVYGGSLTYPTGGPLSSTYWMDIEFVAS